MVRLHVKRGDESQFLIDSSVTAKLSDLIPEVCGIFNGRLKVQRVCYEIEELAKHGAMLPPEMIGLTDEQVRELKLTDPWADKCVPSGGFVEEFDPIGRRNGRRPNEAMQNVLYKAVEDARMLVDKKLTLSNQPLTFKQVDEALHLLKGAVTIVYPMQLPPHDIIRMEFSNTEDLSGTQASKEVIEPAKGQLWFAGRQMTPDKLLKDFVGNNDKTKIVVKIANFGEGPPGREAVITEDVRRRMMADAYRRQEELKEFIVPRSRRPYSTRRVAVKRQRVLSEEEDGGKLDQDDDDQYMNSAWSDGSSLKRQVHGLENVKFRMGM